MKNFLFLLQSVHIQSKRVGKREIWKIFFENVKGMKMGKECGCKFFHASKRIDPFLIGKDCSVCIV